MLKRMLMVMLLVGGFSVVSAAEANAWIVRRVAPVRRIVARRVVAVPIVHRRAVYARPVVYARPTYVAPAYVAPAYVAPAYVAPVVYAAPPVVVGPRVHVRVGVGGYYGW